MYPPSCTRSQHNRIGTRCLRSISYSFGGLDPASMDIFTASLAEQQLADVVILQETHWGCGKEDTQWIMESGWKAIITAEVRRRRSFSGS